MSRQARTRSSLALALVVFLAAGLWFAGRQLARAGENPLKGGDKLGDSIVDASAPAARAAKPARTAVFPVPNDFKVKLIRAGLEPKALCAAVVSSGVILPVLQAAADNMNGAPTSLDSADASYATSRNSADALARKIQSGKASQEEIASDPAAQSALTSAESAQQSVLDGFFSAAIANLPNAQRVALANIRANKGWELPAEYLVVNRTEVEWVALRDALANERIAAELPDTLSQTCQALLATVRADPAVAAARSNMQSGLTLLTNAWNTAAGD
jgi:hypothetical protein